MIGKCINPVSIVAVIQSTAIFHRLPIPSSSPLQKKGGGGKDLRKRYVTKNRSTHDSVEEEGGCWRGEAYIGSTGSIALGEKGREEGGAAHQGSKKETDRRMSEARVRSQKSTNDDGRTLARL